MKINHKLEPKRYLYWNTADSSPQWNELYTVNKHKFLMTASRAPKVFGYYGSSATKQFNEYVHETREKPNDFAEELMQKGKFYEPKALQLFYLLHPEYSGTKPGPVGHPEVHWLYASLDNIAIFKGELVNLEVKCCIQGEIPNKIKPQHKIQVQLQMACVPEVDHTLLIYFKDDKIQVFKEHKDEKLTDQIMTQLRAFNAFVSLGQAPPKGRFMASKLFNL